jgi:hypothetical protein
VKTAVIFLGLILPLSAHAQASAWAGAARDGDAEKARQQKAATDYCVAHPADTDKCIFLPPGVLAQFPNGLPPIPKPPASPVPVTPLTEDQEQILNGTYKPPQVDVPALDIAMPSFNVPASAVSEPIAPLGSPPVYTPAPQPTYEPTCDAACQQAKYQQNYQAGYAIGQALGTIVSGAIEAHRKHKFCKSRPNSDWKYEDGTISTCASINTKQEVRTFPISPEVRTQLRSNADQAHDLMEEFRHDITDYLTKYSELPEAQSALQQSRSSWIDMKTIYCGYYQSGAYTDLDGREQTCDGQRAENSVRTQPASPPTVATLSPIQEDMAHGRTEPSSASGFGTEGLYQSEPDDGSREYLRLYPDGAVIAVTVEGDGTPDEVNKVEGWFHKPFRSSGTYQIQGSAIQFSIQSPEGTVDYQGRMQGTALTLDSFSHINGHQGHATYHLVTVGR